MFSGSMVAIVTPMTADGALDWSAWDRLLDFHLQEGSDGIVVAGTTGESPALSAAEIEELTGRAVARCRDRLKVIVGAGFPAADASAVPVILYNVPSRTAVDLLPSTVARLARHPRIVAIKEATASLSRGREILSACPPEFVLLSGDD